MSSSSPDAGSLEKPAALPPATLAYVGDAVYELHVRERLVTAGGRRGADLHRAATKLVRARAQALALQALTPNLSAAEADVVRRARNRHPTRVPKGSEQWEYRLSTAFEALVGYLYLSGQSDRLAAVLAMAAADGADGDVAVRQELGPKNPNPGDSVSRGESG